MNRPGGAAYTEPLHPPAHLGAPTSPPVRNSPGMSWKLVSTPGSSGFTGAGGGGSGAWSAKENLVLSPAILFISS